MKVEIACGGTGGHILPGVATAMVLEAMGHEVRLWIVGKNVESDASQEMLGHVNSHNRAQNGYPVWNSRWDYICHQESGNHGAAVFNRHRTVQQLLGNGLSDNTAYNADQGNDESLEAKDKDRQDKRRKEACHNCPHYLFNRLPALQMGRYRDGQQLGIGRRRQAGFYFCFDGSTPLSLCLHFG